MRRKFGLIFFLAIAVAAAMGASYFSPLWTMRQIHAAAKQKEVDRLSDYVDFSAVRENLKSVVMAEMSRVAKDAAKGSEPAADFASALVVGFAGAMIDALVTPAGMINLIDKGQFPQPGKQEAAPTQPQDQPAEFSFHYTAWDRAIVYRKDQPEGAFILRRNGPWSWRLVGVKIANWPQKSP